MELILACDLVEALYHYKLCFWKIYDCLILVHPI